MQQMLCQKSLQIMYTAGSILQLMKHTHGVLAVPGNSAARVSRKDQTPLRRKTLNPKP